MANRPLEAASQGASQLDALARGAALPGIVLTCARDVRLEPIKWIWPGWLAAAKFHVLAGAPGTGKTTLALALAATITSAGRWPDDGQAVVGNVLIWSGEDDPKDTLVPRLIGMGADLSKVYFIEGKRAPDGERLPFDPARDCDLLDLALHKHGGAKLLVVDPLVSAVAGDSHNNGDVRRGLQPLVDLGQRHSCAVLGISHFSKGTQGRDPTERVTGSLAFGALARMVLVAAKHRDDEGNEQRIVARAKSNIAPDNGGFVYELQQQDLNDHPGISASVVVWGERLEGPARELLATAEQQDDGGAQSERRDVGEWLQGRLRGGPLPVPELQSEAVKAGFTWRTVERVRAQLGIQSSREGFGPGARYVWRLKSALPAHALPCSPLSGAGLHGEHGENDALSMVSSDRAREEL